MNRMILGVLVVVGLLAAWMFYRVTSLEAKFSSRLPSNWGTLGVFDKMTYLSALEKNAKASGPSLE